VTLGHEGHVLASLAPLARRCHAWVS
jgi:hypothetical protein